MNHTFSPCRIYVHDALRSLTPKAASNLDHGLRRRTPNSWASHQYAIEWHLQQRLKNHPWVVPEKSMADVVYIAANFSLMCFVGLQYGSFFLWKDIVHDRSLWDVKAASARMLAATGPPKFVAFQASTCLAPWDPPGRNDVPPRDLLALRETVEARELEASRSILGPFAVSHPDWLVGREPPPAAVPWSSRKLVFFGGHIPKLYLSPLRYRLWRDLRDDVRVTAFSPTLNCSVGSYSVCARGEEALRNAPFRFLRTFCEPFCGPRAKCPGSDRDTREMTVKRMLYHCKAYKYVNWTSEMPDIARDTRTLSHPEFLSLTLSHRFCLVTPGDLNHASPKIAESIAVAAVGGCLPVIAVPRLAPAHLSDFLPYTRWLDYCRFAYLVPSYKLFKEGGATQLIANLAAISEAELDAKRAEAGLVRDAFVVRAPPGGPQGAARRAVRSARGRGYGVAPFGTSAAEEPTATDYVLDEVCSLARRRRPAQGVWRPPPTPRGGGHERCSSLL